MEIVKSSREKEMAIKKEQSRLKAEAKRKAVERQRRKDEYNRMMIMNKLESQSDKIDNMIQKKKDITKQRKEAMINAKIQRDTISHAMDKIRQHKKWKEADKLLVSISSPKTSNNSKKGKRKGKLKGQGDSGTSSMPALLTPDEQQKAAEAIADRATRGVGAAASGLGTSAAANAVIKSSHSSSLLKGGNQDSMSFVSPYEQSAGPTSKTKTTSKTKVVPAFAYEEGGSIV